MLPRSWLVPGVVVLTVVALVLVGLLIWVALASGTGFGGKTLWDWMELLIIPAVLGPGVVWFLVWFNAQRSRIEREIATERLQKESLQAYLDRMTELLLKHGLRASKPEAVVREVARAHTLTALRGLDRMRRGILLRFLHESGLIKRRGAAGKGVVDLTGTDLTGANLEWAYLPHADLGGANLERADLSWADLSWAKLIGANLSWAKLIGADLSQANLSQANLGGADLGGALLWGADLSGANLSGANLSGANLRGAIVTTEQLESAESLKGATMPDSAKHD